jgi:hypothetical protein
VDSTATCFRSPNYGVDYYGNYEDCAITVTGHQAVALLVTAFSTESDYDSLTVAGLPYSGSSSPDGVQVAAGTTITFTSDGSVTRPGFEICGVSLDERKRRCPCTPSFHSSRTNRRFVGPRSGPTNRGF